MEMGSMVLHGRGAEGVGEGGNRSARSRTGQEGRLRHGEEIRPAPAGVGKGVLEVAEKPNVLARNIYNRGWRKRAMEEGKAIPE